MALVTATVGAGLAGAYMSKRAGDKQAAAVRQGQSEATAEQARQYDLAREDFAPWRDAGVNALRMLRDPGTYFEESPDYEFRRSEGLRDVGNLFAAKGGGGNAMKALSKYASNLASGEFGNWFARNMSLAESGRGATGTTAQVGQNAANQIGSYAMNAGQNIAGIRGNQAANLNNALNSGISNFLYLGQTGRLGKGMQKRMGG